MKKVYCIIIAIVVFVIVLGIVFGVMLLKSPEYALLRISRDVEKDGMDGLMPHLTDEAQETLSTIRSIAENETINSILSFFGKDDYTDILKSNLEKVEWSLDDILKGKEKTDVVLGFNYDDKLIGTVEIVLVRIEGDWKISGIEFPEFSEINL